MRSLLRKLSLLIAVVAISAQAALPPLSDEVREEISSDILTGIVMSSSSEIAQADMGSDRIFYVSLYVTETQKGSVRAGSVIELTYWRANERPDGWCGPGGQYGVMNRGAKVRAYLQKNDGIYSLIEPNGFDVIGSTYPMTP